MIFFKSTAIFPRLVYAKSADLNGSPTLLNGDGDGTVNARSLRACSYWDGMKQQLGKNVTLLELPKIDHMTILSDVRVVKYILDTLLY